MLYFNEMTFEEWLIIGTKNDWCGPPICYVHDGLPVSLSEEEEMYNNDPCLHIIRLYNDGNHRELVESNHSPSQWRK